MQNFIPRKYQNVAGKWMLDNKRCGLFLDMGLGKTIISLLVVNRLMYIDFALSKVLVIGPKKVAESVWMQEVESWAQTKHMTVSRVLGSEKKRKAALAANADIYVINRENVTWLTALYGGNYLPFDMVIVDESSSFKNPKANRTKALINATALTDRVVILTGTPSPNGLLDLWPQLYLLDRGERLGRTLTEYKQRYFSSILVNNQYEKVSLRPGAQEEILAKISDICISMQAKDLLELPDITYNYIPVQLSQEAQNKYDEFEKELILELIEDNIEITAFNAGGLTTKLLQLANGAIYYDEQKNWVTIHDEKIERLLEILEEHDGSPVLIAYSFKHDKERLMTALKKYKPRTLDTDKDICGWNDGKIKIALVHPASAGHGLNLQFGGYTAIWFGLTWNLELYMQFNKRLHRSGQKFKVIIHHLVSKCTEDERVIKALAYKGDVQQFLMDGLKAKIDKYRNIFNAF